MDQTEPIGVTSFEDDSDFVVENNKESVLKNSEVDSLNKSSRNAESELQILLEKMLPKLSLVIAIFCSIFIFTKVGISNGKFILFTDTTPTGGDMGSHVWGPAFMRDNLISNGQLTGWSQDWYQGFPAYRFYMVIPPLMMIILNTGLPYFAGWIVAPILLLACYQASNPSASFHNQMPAKLRKASEYKFIFWPLMILVALLLAKFTYGASFKLVAVSGIISFPLSAWGMGKLARASEPIPGFLALAATVFVFDTNFKILGGNILSTLAGEFSFSISLSLALLAIGMVARGAQDHTWHGRAAILIALVALSHVIPLFFIVPSVFMIMFLRKDISRIWPVAAGSALLIFAFAINPNADIANIYKMISVWALFCLVASFLRSRKILEDVKILKLDILWIVIVGSLAFAIAVFWLVPFLVSGEIHGMFNDMGWERLEEVKENLLTTPMKVALVGAVIGSIYSIFSRESLGILFSTLACFFALLVANLGHGALWNKRILPFFYLSVYIACAIGIAYFIRSLAMLISEKYNKPEPRALFVLSVLCLCVTMVGISIPLQKIPLGKTVVQDDGSEVYSWFGINSNKKSFTTGWAEWNFRGYESKRHYAEYRDVVLTMENIGLDRGCGRAMWEHNESIDLFGTPMALMLLPFWTDGCIASMEGLYFESSASTPFHFLNQSVLSEAPSRAQRNLPYKDFDIDVGVEQLQASGVRYYMAKTDKAIEAARSNAELSEITRYTDSVTGKYVDIDIHTFAIFEVLDSSRVVGLEYLPIVVEGKNFTDIYSDDEKIQSEKDDEINQAVTQETERLEELGFASNEVTKRVSLFKRDLIEKTEREARFELGWVGEAVDFYNDPAAYSALPAEDGPSSWPAASGEEVENRILPSADGSVGNVGLIEAVENPASVSNVKQSNSKITFEVDQIGKPVLVKVSYFPNWQAKGADGPWRVGPNQMVVIPKSNNVELEYKTSKVEMSSNLISISALLLIVFLGFKKRKSSSRVGSFFESMRACKHDACKHDACKHGSQNLDQAPVPANFSDFASVANKDFQETPEVYGPFLPVVENGFTMNNNDDSSDRQGL